MEDMKFLSIGRHFRHSKWKIIVGKNEEENHKLKFWAEESDLLLEAVEIPSPITLIQNPFGKSIPKNIINYAAKLTTRYSDCNNNSCQVRILNDYPNFKSKNLEIILEKIKNDELQKFRVN